MATTITTMHLSQLTLAQLQQFAADFANVCKPPCVLYLQGELGAGKTTLARAILRALGVEGAVKSPTYTLVESYAIDDMVVYHFDLYRVKSPLELASLGISDYICDDSICMIEWPEYGGDQLPAADITCCLNYSGDDVLMRNLELTAHSASGGEMLQRLHKPLKGNNA